MYMLIWLHPNSRPNSVRHIDSLVSAGIPDKDSDPIGYNVNISYMIYEPCDFDSTYSPCMAKGKCMQHFPKR